ncbi:MAG: DUF2961 domain-containing protein [Chloroflexota bacterium]|nr:DUF2961 domain-containing protein [Chloroflexota bacterium]
MIEPQNGIEHRHANHLSDDWASRAYWYQLQPSPPAAILPVGKRLPHRPADPPMPRPVASAAEAQGEADRNRAAYEQRRKTYVELLERRIAERRELAAAFQQGNIEAARKLRERFR